MNTNLKTILSGSMSKRLTTIVLGGVLLQGCTTTGVPGVPTSNVNDLKNLTAVNSNGIVYYQQSGQPVAGVENACRMLSREVRDLGRKNNNSEKTAEDLRKTVSKAYKGRKSKSVLGFMGNAFMGTTKATFGVIGVGISAGGRAMDRNAQEKRIEELDRHCEQNKALEVWERAQPRCLVRLYDDAAGGNDGTTRGRYTGETVVSRECVQDYMNQNYAPSSLLPSVKIR